MGKIGVIEMMTCGESYVHDRTPLARQLYRETNKRDKKER
jgi:hypothetical protein